MWETSYINSPTTDKRSSELQVVIYNYALVILLYNTIPTWNLRVSNDIPVSWSSSRNRRIHHHCGFGWCLFFWIFFLFYYHRGWRRHYYCCVAYLCFPHWLLRVFYVVLSVFFLVTRTSASIRITYYELYKPSRGSLFIIQATYYYWLRKYQATRASFFYITQVLSGD